MAESSVVVLVDGSNVARCDAWQRFLPVGDDHQRRVSLMDIASGWAAQYGYELTVVFDGAGPWGEGSIELSSSAQVVGSGSADGDAVLERLASVHRRAGRVYWLVTSDGVLRQVAGGGAERIFGAEAFVAELVAPRELVPGAAVHSAELASSTRMIGADLDEDIRARLERMRRGEG